MHKLFEMLQQAGYLSLLLLGVAFITYQKLCWLYLHRTSAASDHYNQALSITQIWIASAPLIGLLGTVTGIQSMFTGLIQGAEDAMTTGIAQALLTTEIGLMVAAPAMIFLGYLQTKQQRKELGDA